MPIPTVTELNEAKEDIDDLEALVNGFSTVTTRLGGNKQSLSQLLSNVTHGSIAVYDPTETISTIDQWRSYTDTSVSPNVTTVYRPIPSALPITQTSPLATSPDTNKWVVAAGFKLGDRIHPSVDNYAALRAIPPASVPLGTVITVTDSGIAGDFVCRANTTSPQLTDNGGTIITNSTWNAAGKHWSRVITNNIGNLEWFGVDLSGSVESSDAVKSFIASGLDLAPCAGVILVNPATPIVISSSANRSFIGVATDTLEFVTSLDDGSTIFQCTGQWQNLGEFSVNSSDGTQKDFVAMEFGDQGSGTSLVRSRIKTKVANSSGWQLRGWINDVYSFTALNTGSQAFHGRELNSCTLTLRSENDEKAFDIDEIYGTTINQLLIEGVPSGTSQTSNIDDFIGVNIGSIYTEGGGWDTTVLEFGKTNPGQHVHVAAANITGNTLDRTPMVRFNQCQSVTGSMDVATGSVPTVVDVTSNTKHNGLLAVGRWSVTEASRIKNFTQDNSLNAQIHANYSGDTYLDHYLATFPNLTQTNCTVSQETSNLRSGRRGIRVTATNGTHLSVATLARDVANFPKMANLVGKTIKAFAWIYVPNVSGFSDYTINPAFAIAASGGASSFPAAQRPCVAGQWTLVETADLTIPGGWTGTSGDKINFEFYVTHNSKAVTTSHYIIVDSIFITETKCDIRDILSGRVRECSTMFGIKTDGSRLEVQSDNYHSMTATHISLSVGEVTTWLTPAASSSVGYAVTTAGTVGGTAVFKSRGNHAS